MDGYIRIPQSTLHTVSVDHIASALDPSLTVPPRIRRTLAAEHIVTGFSEWGGVWELSRISIGWDWALAQSRVLLLNPTEIRTNILLLKDDGTDTSPAATKKQLSKWIETLAARDPCVRQLLQACSS